MRLLDILPQSRVSTRLEATDKDGVLRELSEMFLEGGSLTADDVFRALSEREQLASTGVGSGVAIPHGRVPQLDGLRAALAIHPAGVPFDSVDDLPARIFVVLVSPEQQTGEHLKALARVSRVLRSEPVRARLLQAKNAIDAREIFVDAD